MENLETEFPRHTVWVFRLEVAMSRDADLMSNLGVCGHGTLDQTWVRYPAVCCLCAVLMTYPCALFLSFTYQLCRWRMDWRIIYYELFLIFIQACFAFNIYLSCSWQCPSTMCLSTPSNCTSSHIPSRSRWLQLEKCVFPICITRVDLHLLLYDALKVTLSFSFSSAVTLPCFPISCKHSFACLSTCFGCKCGLGWFQSQSLRFVQYLFYFIFCDRWHRHAFVCWGVFACIMSLPTSLISKQEWNKPSIYETHPAPLIIWKCSLTVMNSELQFGGFDYCCIYSVLHIACCSMSWRRSVKKLEIIESLIKGTCKISIQQF